MQKCKQCEWEFPDDIRICPYCGHPVEPEDQKQKQRFNLHGHPDTLLAGVKQPSSGLAPSPTTPTTPSKKLPRLVILVSIITAILLLGSTVTVYVWARGSTPSQAKLNVDPPLLDFGSHKVGIQKTLLLTVSNSGGQELRWKIDKGKILWLTLDRYSGMITAGAHSQNINVKVDTTTLTPGHYSTTIHFSSNGGNAQVVVLLIVPPGVTETPSPTPTPTPITVQRQITSTRTQSQTVKATGTGQDPATQATGMLTFYNLRADYSFIVPAGQIWTGADGIQVVNDAPVCLDPISSYTVGYSVPAHTLQTGPAANIAVDDVNMIWGVSPYASKYLCSRTSPSPGPAYRSALYVLNVPLSGTQQVRNNNAFTGGQDAQSYTFVQKNDIDGASASLQNATQQSAIHNIQQQIQSNEHLVGDPQCTSNVSSDHSTGDRVSQVTVTVTTTCKATAST
jgi:hypothetical protein